MRLRKEFVDETVFRDLFYRKLIQETSQYKGKKNIAMERTRPQGCQALKVSRRQKTRLVARVAMLRTKVANAPHIPTTTRCCLVSIRNYIVKYSRILFSQNSPAFSEYIRNRLMNNRNC